jgi:hypothetical protein
MSARITVIVYILICFEVGILLLILPWKPQYWEDNFFLYFITGKLDAPWLQTFLTSGYVRGAVTGLGVLNILAGLRDLFRFRESVNALAAVGHSSPENEKEGSVESPAAQTVALPDHRPPDIHPQA